MSEMQPANTPQAGSSGVPPQGSAPVVKKARWGRRLLVLLFVFVLLLVGLVAFAPTIASIPAVTNYGLGYANDMLRGRIAVDRVSLSWMGDSTLSGVKVIDPAGRDCAAVQSVVVPGGLMRLVRDYYNIGKVTVTSPEVVLHIDKQGNIALVDAVSPKQPSTSSGGAIRMPDAELVVTGGKLRVVQEGGGEYVVPKLDLNLRTQPPGGVVATLDVGLPDGSGLRGDVDVQDLLANGALQIAKARGKAKIATRGDVDLGPLGDALLGKGQLAGKLTLDAAGDFAAGAVTADLKGGVKGLQSSKVATDTVKPLDLQLTGKVRTDGDKVGGDVALDGGAGKVAGQFEYALNAPPAKADADIAAALLAGKAPHLPDFKLDAKGQVDLVALADAVPALLHIRPGTKITGGKVEISKVAAGGPTPFVTTDLSVTGLSAIADGKTVSVEPITAQLDVGTEDGGALRIRKAEVQSGFGKLVASGTPTDLDATFDGDLAKVQQQLGQILELPVDELAGTLHADLSAKRSGDERVDVTANATGQSVRCRSGAGTLAIEKLQVAHTGAAKLAKGELQTYEIAKADLDAGGKARADVKGSYDAVKQGFAIDANVPEADVAYVDKQLSGLGIKALAGYTGRLQLQTRVSRPDAAGAVQSQGTLKITELALDGKALTPTLDASWNDLAYSPAEGLLRVPAAKLESAVATVSASKLELRTVGKVQVAGDVEASADLEKAMPVVGRIAGMAEAPTLAGQLALKMNCRSDGTTSTVAGEGDIKNFRAGTDTRGQQENVSFKYDAAIDAVKRALEIKKLDLDAAGKVRVGVKGSYDIAKQGFAIDANIPEADVAYLDNKLAGLGIKALAGYAGRLQLQTRVSRPDAAGAVQSQGTLKIADLALDGKALTPALDASWNDLAYSPADGLLRVPAAKLDSAVATVNASKLEVRTAGKVQVAGDIETRADLEKTLALVGKAAGMAEPPALAGQLALKVNCRSDGTISTLVGDGDIKNFRAGTDTRTQQESVSFKYDAAIDSAKRAVEIKKLNLDAPAMALDLTGRLDDWSGGQRLDVKGPYTLHWDKAMSMLYTFAPSVKDKIAIAGEHKGNLQITGPLNQAGATPAYRGLAGGLDVSWQKADALGISLSPAKLAPAMQDAKVQLPTVKIAAAGGAVNLGGTLDMSGPEPVLKLPPDIAILSKVKVTPQLAEQVLSRFNPIFGKVTRVEGNVQLTARGVELPLGKSLTTGGKGGGRLELENFKVQPAGLLALLVELGSMGTADMYAIEVSGTDFTVHDGRINYDNLTMRFAQNAFDLIFRGSVGFDDSLDLIVSVPVRQGLLNKLNFSGPMAQFSDAMADLRVEVPISGTRENPKLDFSKTNVGKVFEGGLEQAVKNAGKSLIDGDAAGGIGGLIEGITGTGEDAADAGAPEAKKGPSPKPGASPRPPSSPRPASSPKPSASPKPSGSPKPSASPKPRTPKPSASPTASPTPTPAPKGTPAPSSSPKPAKKKPVRSPTPSPTP